MTARFEARIDNLSFPRDLQRFDPSPVWHCMQRRWIPGTESLFARRSNLDFQSAISKAIRRRNKIAVTWRSLTLPGEDPDFADTIGNRLDFGGAPGEKFGMRVP
jgi:hypothetical protein